MAQTTLPGLATNLPQIGAAADYYGPLYSLKRPLLTDFTASNQGGATATQVAGTVYVTMPTSATDDLRFWEKAVPGGTYTVTMGFVAVMPAANSYRFGMSLRDSVGGKIVVNSFRSDAGGVAFDGQKYTNTTTLSGNYYAVSMCSPVSSMVFVQLSDNGTNRIFRYSIDGVNFFQLGSSTNTDFVTPNKIGFFSSVANSTNGMQATVIHWDGV